VKEEEMKKEVERIAKEVFGKEVDESTKMKLIIEFRKELSLARSRGLKEDYAANVARHFTRLFALEIKRAKGMTGEW